MQLYMIELNVTDLQRSVRWYQTNLEMGLVLNDVENGFVLLQDSKQNRVALKQSDRPTTNVILHWKVADLEATIQVLQDRNVEVSEIQSSPEGYHAVTIHDPDGIRLNIFAWT